MDPRELLAICTTRGIKLDTPPGGIPDLTSSDIAAAMGIGSLKREEADILLFKYCGDITVRSSIWAWHFEQIVRTARQESWRWRKGQLEILAVVTLSDFLADHICPACNGTQSAIIDNKKVYCPVCEGVGKLLPTDRMYRKHLGVSKSAFSSFWKRRVDRCISQLQQTESNAIYKWVASL